MGKKTAKSPMTGLTVKQDDFCFQCIRLGDHNKAYRVAYQVDPESKMNVHAEAAKLLKLAPVQDRLRDLQAMADRRLEVSIERIAKELARIAFSDFADLFDENGNAIPMHMLPEDVRRAVHSVDIVEKQTGQLKIPAAGGALEFVPERVKKIRLHDKHSALLTLAKWKRMVVDRAEDAAGDPNDIRSLTDDALENELRATKAALEMIDRARGRKGARALPKVG